MNLEFNHLTIEGFNSFAALQRIDLKQHGVGLHFICGRNEYEPELGSNGAGKSSISDALCWCLYGKTIDGRRTPDVKPWRSKKTPHVKLEMLIDSKRITIDRSTSPNQLSINDKESSQEEVDKRIGLSQNVIPFTVIMGQGMPLFFDLEPRQKMAVFADALNLDRWGKRSAAASDYASKLQYTHAALTGELTGWQTSLSEIKSLINTTQKRADLWEQDFKERSETREKTLSELQDKLTTHQKALDTATLSHEAACVEARALDKEIFALQMELSELKDQQNELTTRRAVLQHKLLEVADTLKALGDADTCPTCGQSLKGTNLASHKKELKTQCDETKKAIDRIEADRRFLDQIKVREDRILTAQKHYHSFTDKAERAEAFKNISGGQVSVLTTKVNAIKLSAKDDQQINPHNQQLRDLRKRLNVTTKSITDCEEDIKITLRRIERAKFWIKGFKDVQLYIIEEVLDELEMASNAMLAEVGLHDWSIQYAIEKETQSGTIQRGLNVSIMSPSNDKPVKWKCWSGGEGQRLRIIGSLALSEVLLNHAGIRTNLEILDEPTQHLSQEGTRDICAFLALRAQNLNRQCWLIDHTAVPSAEFTSSMTVVKRQDGTSMIEEE